MKYNLFYKASLGILFQMAAQIKQFWNFQNNIFIFHLILTTFASTCMVCYSFNFTMRPLRLLPWLLSVTFSIKKTCLCNLDPLKPHFNIVKQGYTLFFLFLLKNIDSGYSIEPPRGGKNIDCGYSLEPPCGGGSNKYPQSYALSRNIKKY